MDFDILMTNVDGKLILVLKIMTGQRSLTIVKASVTTEKPCRTITMTATT